MKRKPNALALYPRTATLALSIISPRLNLFQVGTCNSSSGKHRGEKWERAAAAGKKELFIVQRCTQRSSTSPSMTTKWRIGGGVCFPYGWVAPVNGSFFVVCFISSSEISSSKEHKASFAAGWTREGGGRGGHVHKNEWEIDWADVEDLFEWGFIDLQSPPSGWRNSSRWVVLTQCFGNSTHGDK